MAGAEGVVGALAAAQEAGRAVRLLDLPERVAASGQRLVAVGLVPDVPDDAVARRVEDRVEGDGQLDRAEAAGEVAADPGADVDEVGAQLARQPDQRLGRHGAQRARILDARKCVQTLSPRIAASADARGGARELRGSTQPCAKQIADRNGGIGQLGVRDLAGTGAYYHARLMRLWTLAALVALSVVVSSAALLATRIPLALIPWQWRVGAEQLLYRPWLGPASLGDGQPAENILLCYPMGLALDRAGDLLISDRGRDQRGRVVWRIDAKRIAHVVAGTGRIGDATEPTALELSFLRPEGLAVGEDGSLFVSDAFLHVVVRIAPDGRAEHVAGRTGQRGYSGDGGPASEAMLFEPADLELDRRGNLYIADVRNQRVRRVDPSGRISTVAGTGERGFSPDGTLATEARIDTPWGVGLDLEDRLLIGDGANHRVRRVERDGRLVTLAGNGNQGYSGDGGPATAASFNYPEGLFVDPRGRLFIGDEWNNSVRMIDEKGIISTVMGTGFPGKAQLGGTARVSPLDDPENVLYTPKGLIISDGNNGRVLRISAAGIIELVAGRGTTEPCSMVR